MLTVTRYEEDERQGVIVSATIDDVEILVPSWMEDPAPALAQLVELLDDYDREVHFEVPDVELQGATMMVCGVLGREVWGPMFTIGEGDPDELITRARSAL